MENEVQEVNKVEVIENKKTGLIRLKYIKTFDAGKEIAEYLDKLPNKSEFIRAAITSYIEQRK